MIKADFHNHLGRNGANPGFDETIDLVYDKFGPNFIFGIANFTDNRYENFIDQKGGKYNRVPIQDKTAIYVPDKKMLILKGQEFTKNKEHILALAVPYGKSINQDKNIEAMKESKDLGASLIAVHPFYKEGIGNRLEQNQNLLDYFSSIEVYNGSAEFWLPFILPRNANDKAIAFYFDNIFYDFSPNKFNIGMSSGTDGHSVEAIGTCYTELPYGSLSSKNLSYDLNKALREIKFLGNLHMQPNKKDAAIHTWNMILATVFKKR